VTDNKEKPKNIGHMPCRAKHDITGESNCPGTEAVVVSKVEISGGGRRATYKCLTCGRAYAIFF